MANSNNRHGLRIVQEGDATLDRVELLVAAPGGRRVQVIEGDVARARIGMMLRMYFVLRLDPRGENGISVTLPVRCKDRDRGVDGDLELCGGAEVVVPRGTIAQWMSEAA